MTEQQINESIHGLLNLAHDGKILEAIDKYYHDDVVTQEGLNGEPRKGGKKSYLEFYKDFLDNMTEVNTFKGKAHLVGENVSAIAWDLDFNNNLWGKINFTELAIQEWKDGKIFKETYFYNPQV
ncbi:nuclear transport factor 2 family protein [Aquimarina sediminis]|uniref:nuclear transport factor 2 family protein n=1 Tax=Aquimarina sediminis TaxID=2070536 RepID=UPI000CA00B0E|nr:nuclear transport factor 2 family protein [Aquimarina sediminis]